MKKLITLIIVIGVAVGLKAQSYPPMFNNTAWYIHAYSTWSTQDYYYWAYQSIDTVIGSKTYAKVVRLSAPYGDDYLFREDTAARKVYKFDNGAEYLLYDFSKHTGDTIDRNGNICTIRVDSFLTNIGYKKSFSVWMGAIYLDSYRELTGNGSDPWFFIGTDPEFFLECMYQGNTRIIGDGSCPPNPYAAVNGIEKITNAFAQISPNPCTTSFTIQLSEPPVSETYFQLYDALGRQVKREAVSAITTTIYRNNLPRGIYFWQLEQGNKMVERGKVVFE